MPRHEQGLVHAADGYARSTGKVGVCLVTSGPGATNLVTGIATANYDSVPLVCFTGKVPTSLIGNDAFQEVDICPEYTPDFIALAESYGAKGIRVTKPEDIKTALISAKKNTKTPTVIEFIIDREINVMPIVPPGNPLNDMILESEESTEWFNGSSGMYADREQE